MKLLELHAGSRSVGKEAYNQGLEVFSVDWTAYENIDLVIVIGDLKTEDVPFVPDIIWSSPDCTTYSIAGCRTHRTKLKEAKSEYAKKCDSVNMHCMQLIRSWMIMNPNLVFLLKILED